MEYRRTNISGRYFGIEIHECPIDVILFAAILGADNVTVENYRHQRNPNSLAISLCSSGATVVPRLKQLTADFCISKQDFISLGHIWNTQGCYAVFCDRDNLSFSASSLREESRYTALDHFGWSLEIAIPDSSGGEWGRITSPAKAIIDKIEARLRA